MNGAERKGEGESQADSTINTEPDIGLNLTNHEIMTKAKIKSQTLNQLSHPGAPLFTNLMLISNSLKHLPDGIDAVTH